MYIFLSAIVLSLMTRFQNNLVKKISKFIFYFSYLLPDRSARAKQKTSVCRRTTAPRWETTLAWEDVGDLETRALELTLWETDRMGHHEEMGGVRLNLGTGNNSLFVTSSGRGL